ncbi:hypothetical protein KVT40_005122 [Elsinoe batatas]|uniref:Uncharacterized protein n=1 Tax=Elsinoe batatas TaxID=2601811 RepID=A0A8K0L374_9PEZI|nr:hypothetical protein KVT40_005122 [Elsinoe batatas]
MSLIPSLQQDLRLPRLRTQNRRSKHTSYARGRVAEVCFIITRADLLAPKKEQVDTLLPYLRELLRDALGNTGKNVRLGNVKCVSAKRGWWTKAVKEEIWSRGGAGWLVGKVNVGKSSLFEVVFPKGRGAAQSYNPSHSDQGLYALEQAQRLDALSASTTNTPADVDDPDEIILSEESDLLPPPQPERAFPSMPISSALPGTTASPIRIPFGAGKGELIDLPGIVRSTLENHLVPSQRAQLIMSSRLSPEQIVIKPGQSLLIGGGLVRITNPSEKDVLLAYPFVPLDTHLTSTTKAEELRKGERDMDIPSVLATESKSSIKSAGKMELKWDVTKARAGPLTRKDAVGLKAERLPFVVWSADVVIEGVGWIELVAQRRRRDFDLARREEAFKGRMQGHEEQDGEKPFADTPMGGTEERVARRSIWPTVEVFSPEGKHVAIRRPMGAWLLAQKVKKKVAPGARQRRSMRSVKMSDAGRKRMADG